MEKMLFVAWNKRERTTYWVDKDAYSRAHQEGNVIILEAYEGAYHFDLETKTVLLQSFSETIVPVLEWRLFEEPIGHTQTNQLSLSQCPPNTSLSNDLEILQPEEDKR